MMTAPDFKQKLPVFKTLKLSFQLLGKHIFILLWCNWLSIAALLGSMTFSGGFSSSLSPEQQKIIMENNTWTLFGLSFVFIFAFGIGMVNSYRFLLLNEKPSGIALQIRGRERLYLGWVMGLSLMTLLYCVFVGVTVAALHPLEIFLVPVAFISYIALALRISFIWPAIALDDKISWRTSWQQTRGNSWRIFAGNLAIFILFSATYIVLAYGLSAVAKQDHFLLRPILSIMTFVTFFSLCFMGLIYKSLAYRQLVLKE